LNGLAPSAHQPAATSRQSLQPCVSSWAFSRPPNGKKPYIREDHFKGGRPVNDFSASDDTIALSRSIFGGIGSSVSLAVGSGANAATAQIVYNNATGALSYDADGTGALAQMQFAQLSSGLALTSGNFVLI
ncbi:hypothetical protein AB4097_21065, partial [Microvirga sp. 2MCAF35]